MVKSYVAPFVLYLVGTMFVASLPEGYYPIGYATVVAIVTLVTIFLLFGRGVIRPHRHVWEGVAVGIIGIFAWIVISDWELERTIAKAFHLPLFLTPGKRVAYNPFEEMTQPWMVYSFIAVRLFGLAVLVPIVEEVFWRGFLSRWLVSEEWETVPLGTFTRFSFVYVSALFTLAHPEWFAAAFYAVLINWLFFWKKDLWPCIVAHSVSNLILGLYVITAEAWTFW